MKIGDKVRIVRLMNQGNGLSKTLSESKIGTIVSINKDFITIQLENYRVSFNFVDMVNPTNKILQIRKDKQLQDITLEDINSSIGLQHLIKKGKFLLKEEFLEDYKNEVEYNRISLRKIKFQKSSKL